MSNAILSEELEALTAIYADTMDVHHGGDDSVLCTVSVTIPRAVGAIAASFSIAPIYPEQAPTVQLEGFGKGDAGKKQLADKLKTMADEMIGSPMLFALVEAVRELYGDSYHAPSEELTPVSAPVVTTCAHPATSRGIAIAHGEPSTFNKSIFQAHCAVVHSSDDVNAVLEELTEDARIARATHNILAYRIVDSATGHRIADCDDDGEDAAGGRLAHLLELMQVENVVVVVSRWFGGTLLGPARFRYINEAARVLIESQHWYKGRVKK